MVSRDSSIISVTRAVYGKKGTPQKDREYTVDGSGSTAVGTIKELKAFFPNLKVIRIKDRFEGNSIVRVK